MKKLIVLLIALVVLSVNPAAMAAPVYFDDGASYTFDNDTYQDDSVKLDYYTANDPGTGLYLVDGGLVYELYAYNSASITMTGGSVDSLWACGNGIVTVTGGSVGQELGATDNGTVTMSGGSVDPNLFAWENATVTITGGSVGNVLEARTNATIYLDGTGFQVNGTPLVNGDKLSDFVTLAEGYYTGTITGTLSDGSALDNTFKIYDTAEIIIGEHCNFVLAGDLDGNCKLDLADLAVMAANWLIDCNANPADPACVPKTY